MMRPGGSARPRNGSAFPLPVTPEMLAALAQAIAGGVTDVAYADRRVSFMSLDDLLRAFEWCAAQLGIAQHVPSRRVACFSKGLEPSSPAWATGGGPEHVEIADALWSRQIERPMGPEDIDWEHR